MEQQRTADLAERPWLDPRAEPFIHVQGVLKRFGEFTAVDNVDVKIYRGELFCLLGGSGCGKTTLLRMLAGFETPTSGRVVIDGVDMTPVPPYDRPVNMMFQSYALFPHMTVEKNVAYGLKRDGFPQAEIADRVAAMLDLVQLSPFAKRRPHQLSGGQRQRVALARALVKQPKVLLLDEPLGALDKKLREQTQFELMAIQERLGVTFVVVTHDQEEAMTLSTRIAVMDRGKIVQTGTPTDVYEFPETRFTADFIGSINLFEGVVTEADDRQLVVRSDDLGCEFLVDRNEGYRVSEPVCVAVRPEKIRIENASKAEAGRNAVKGVVQDMGYLGNQSIFRVRTESGHFIKVMHQNTVRAAEDDRSVDWDDEVLLSWQPASLVVLTQ